MSSWGLPREPLLLHNVRMGKQGGRQPDRRKPARMVRVRSRYAEQIDRLVSRNGTDFTEEVNRAVRELLTREGLWPPPPAPG